MWSTKALRIVAIAFNILALLGLATAILVDSADDGPFLLVVVFIALISSLTTLLWPESQR